MLPTFRLKQVQFEIEQGKGDPYRVVTVSRIKLPTSDPLFQWYLTKLHPFQPKSLKHPDPSMELVESTTEQLVGSRRYSLNLLGD